MYFIPFIRVPYSSLRNSLERSSLFFVLVRCQQWSAGCDGFNVGRRVHEAYTYLGTTP